MALQKQPFSLNFTKGIETKTDPYQIPLGSFAALTNTVFSTTGRLTKRNGYPIVTTLPNTNQTTLTSLNDNLIATGSNLFTYNQEINTWKDQGKIQPIQLSVQSIVRNSTSQSGVYTAVNTNGLTCVVYMDSGNSYYHVVDSSNGSQVVERTQLPATATNPKVFILGARFIITFIATVAATPTLQYIPLLLADPDNVGAATNISSDVNGLIAGYDGYVDNTRLFLSWGASTAAIKTATLRPTLSLLPGPTVAGNTAARLSITANTATQRVYVSFWDSVSTNGYAVAFDYSMTQVMALTTIIATTVIKQITSIVDSTGLLNIFYETANTYSYSSVTTDFISSLTVTLPGVATNPGVVSTPAIILRSVGLASKPFISPDNTIYLMVAYGDMNQSPSTNNSNQPTYFLIDSTGAIYMRLAYSNGGGYISSNVLPSITLVDETYYFPYQITDFLTTVNKGTALPTGTPANAIYTQTGVNLALFTLNNNEQYSSEIAGALHLTGGQLWEFDTVKPVEHGFHVYPENITVTTATGSGNITAQDYFYVATYEWTDNAGQLHRSAPSIPVKITTTTATSTNTINVPTLRLTSKISPNPVRIVLYRWSTAQQIYYQVTSITNPPLNNTTIDSVVITDALADSAILGTTLLYTTGGVIENIAAPASIDSTLFDNRLWLIDAEDPNLLWYSKQVIQNVPVEMSDLLTIYVAPTTGVQGSTGPSRALASMDDKLIVFKDNALYYINGNGPDNTGSNNSYSQPVYITGTIGSNNPNSIVLTPMGLMFQTNKGIWLLARDLSTKYIGAPVEGFNSETVISAEVVPNTTQVRMVLSNYTTLMYDYYFDQWGVHTNNQAISAIIWSGQHTYLNIYGQIYQETANVFKDGSEPVLISLTTSWVNVAGIQGFERFYQAFLLGTYKSPFKLNVSFAYNYNPSPVQNVIVTPVNNPAENYGDEALWGSGPEWGGSEGDVFTGRVFPQIQKCSSFQMTIQEIYDPSLGQAAGEGLSLSGLNLIIGMKKGSRTQRAAKSFG